MRFLKALLPALFLSCFLAAHLHAQTPAGTDFGLDPGQVSVLDVGFNYAFFHANAPPAQCGCFSISGGGGTFVIHAVHGISLVADVSGGHANAVNGTTQNIGILDYLGGLRFSYHPQHRYTPYLQALAGASAEYSNYAFVQNASAFAALGGGGLQTRLSRHFGLTLFEADYLYSRLPNAGNNRQNDLRILSGILLRFGPR